MFTIIGSGFGLYGYLPAVLESEMSKVCLPSKYRKLLLSRSDIRNYDSLVIWLNSTEDCIKICNSVIIATNPARQHYYVEYFTKQNKYRDLYLEKPISISPQSSMLLLKNTNGLNIKINYSFIYLDWFQSVKSYFSKFKNSRLRISWKFTAHHIRHDNRKTWKNNESQGGGIINFYGIHLIATISKLGTYRAMTSHTKVCSNEYTSKWEASFCDGDNTIEVSIDTNSPEKSFFVQIESRNSSSSVNHSFADPFETSCKSENADRRIEVVRRYLLTQTEDLDFYMQTCKLWSEILKINNK